MMTLTLFAGKENPTSAALLLIYELTYVDDGWTSPAPLS